ncbi:hypothetical protein JTB14_006669 [Gonioctena quinquepunctata]|nr:hypothetical protein JTB14_006669 [Gonioctena quinquepunctata]
MYIDTERLITAVRLRPMLWDLSHNLYKERDAKLKAWIEVCQSLFPNFDALCDSGKKLIEKNVLQRWKTARDAYVRCRAMNTKSGSGSEKRKKYIYFENMQFIDKKHVEKTEDSFEANQDTINASQIHNVQLIKQETSHDVHSSNQNAINDDQYDTDASETNIMVQSEPQKRRRKNSEEFDFDREMLQILKDNSKLMQNDDMAFFCSLLPIMQTFSMNQKLLFRSEVLKKTMEISNSAIRSPTCCEHCSFLGSSNASLIVTSPKT